MRPKIMLVTIILVVVAKFHDVYANEFVNVDAQARDADTQKIDIYHSTFVKAGSELYLKICRKTLVASEISCWIRQDQTRQAFVELGKVINSSANGTLAYIYEETSSFRIDDSCQEIKIGLTDKVIVSHEGKPIKIQCIAFPTNIKGFKFFQVLEPQTEIMWQWHKIKKEKPCRKNVRDYQIAEPHNICFDRAKNVTIIGGTFGDNLNFTNSEDLRITNTTKLNVKQSDKVKLENCTGDVHETKNLELVNIEGELTLTGISNFKLDGKEYEVNPSDVVQIKNGVASVNGQKIATKAEKEKEAADSKSNTSFILKIVIPIICVLLFILIVIICVVVWHKRDAARERRETRLKENATSPVAIAKQETLTQIKSPAQHPPPRNV